MIKRGQEPSRWHSICRPQFITKEQDFNKEMEVQTSTSHPKASQGWEPGKCIPQYDKPPRYTINSTKVGEHTQFMKEHALIRKFLGLWPLERDLMRWIKAWWSPKGDYEVQLSSKGFFMIILYSLEDKDQDLRQQTLFLQLCRAFPQILDGSLQSRERGFYHGTSMDPNLLLTPGFLA
jgi:hypothetical protein